MSDKVIVNYKYRLYPNKQQIDKFNQTLSTCKYVWNYLLDLKSEIYQECKISISKNDLNNYITTSLSNTLNTKVHSQVLQNVSNRLDAAFNKFFTEKDAGYPQFKSFVSSFTYPQTGFKILLDDKKRNKVKLSQIGVVNFVYHRPIVGKIKTCTIKKVSKHNPNWYIIFSVEQLAEDFHKIPANVNNDAVGMDIGIKIAYALSDGTIIENPHFLKKSKQKLRSAQRKLSRKVKGSSNSKKQYTIIAKIHEHVANQRNDWQFKNAHHLVNTYHVIAAENISPNFMLKNHKLAYAASDMSWSTLFNKLEYEAFKYDTMFGVVNAKNTSQLCSSCNEIVAKDLDVRVHICPYCGLNIDRDINAAINIIKRASEREGFPSPLNLLIYSNENTAGTAEINACGENRPLISCNTGYQVDSLKQEALTSEV